MGVPRVPALLAVLLLASVAGAAAQQAAGASDHPGKPVYDKWCAGCHGVEGDGEGEAAAWMLPRPRDFTTALYQIRTTPSGALPTDADIRHVIDVGMPGTAMPGWESRLTRRQREDLVAYLKTFSRFFEMEDAPEPVAIGRQPGGGAEALEDGARVYREMECWKCHGDAGRGDGASAPTQTDDGGFPIRPADLTEPWYFNGGGSVEAIYTRLKTGLDGTPMPSYAELVSGGIITEDQLWHLAMYVRSLAPEEGPALSEVVRAERVEGGLPASTADSAWAGIDPTYIPLVGQIIVEPRWFSPTVDGVWVQAAHDGQEVVLRLVWHDPSRSPDPAWESWRALLAEHLAPAEGEQPSAQPPDAFTVQFPSTMPDGRELPFFLGGDGRSPVYLWRWRSDREGVEEALGRGLDQVEPLPVDAESPGAIAEYDAGAWRLVIRRSLASGDPGRRLAMPEGAPIPIAFFARDGSSGEVGSRGSLSSWYYLYLDQPAPVSTYTVPIAAALLTALLGVVVVRRAQNAGRRAGAQESETLLEGV